GHEGTQDSYITIFLQFGFTKRGIAKLPHWLSEGVNKPRSIELLCAGPSNPFSRMWREIHAYRRGMLAGVTMREILQSCPFILDDWCESILDSARGTRAEVVADKGQRSSRKEESRLLGGPYLRWDGLEEPYLWAEINPAAAGFSDFGYTVLVNDEPHGRLI